MIPTPNTDKILDNLHKEQWTYGCEECTRLRATAARLAGLLKKVYEELTWDDQEPLRREIDAALADYENVPPSDQRAGASPAPSESRC